MDCGKSRKGDLNYGLGGRGRCPRNLTTVRMEDCLLVTILA